MIIVFLLLLITDKALSYPIRSLSAQKRIVVRTITENFAPTLEILTGLAKDSEGFTSLVDELADGLSRDLHISGLPSKHHQGRYKLRFVDDTLLIQPVEIDSPSQLIIGEIKSAIDKLAKDQGLLVDDGVFITASFAGFLRYYHDSMVAENFYRFLGRMTDALHHGAQVGQLLKSLGCVLVSTDIDRKLYATEVDNDRYVYFAVESHELVFGGFYHVNNPHNISVIGKVRNALADWRNDTVHELGYYRQQLIDKQIAPVITRPVLGLNPEEIVLRTMTVANKIAGDYQAIFDRFAGVHGLLPDSSTAVLVDKYLDQLAELYSLLFDDSSYDDLSSEIHHLIGETVDDRVVATADYPAVLEFLDSSVVDELIYARNLSNIHHQKILELVDNRLITDLLQTAEILSDNVELIKNPEVIESLRQIGINLDSGRLALADLLRDWQQKFQTLRRQHIDLRVKLNDRINNLRQQRQDKLDLITVELMVGRPGWTTLGLNKRVVVTSQFAEFFQHNKMKLHRFSFQHLVNRSGTISKEQLELATAEGLFSAQLPAELKKMFDNLLDVPDGVKLVGRPHLKRGGSMLAINGFYGHHQVSADARPIYQINYDNYRIYVQFIHIGERWYFALLNGFRKERPFLVPTIKWMQKNRQSKIIIDSMNILAGINLDNQVDDLQLGQLARQLY